MTVEVATKRCCFCRQEKPVSEFGKQQIRPGHKDGLSSRCKVCRALRRRQLAARPKIHVDQKVCSRCNELKAASEFSKDAEQRDGLRYVCRECNNAYRARFRQRQIRIPTTKVCSQCGSEKAACEFSRDHYHTDGLRSNCKECDKLSARARRVTKRCTTKEERESWNALSTWQQVPELLREMAELQLNINSLNADCKRRLAVIEKETADARLPCIMRQTKLHFMLEGFISRGPERFIGIRKVFPFGTVLYSGHTLRVHLHTQFAALKLGKHVSGTALVG